MSGKWTKPLSESGILRKSEFKEKKEELFVFGYSCKLFRDDEKAIIIDQGKHLIPWMGDESLKIDRYDARGALHDLSLLEAPPGGYDWRVELTRTEQEVEQLCDEERYRALHTDEDEEEMYKEEELKRLHKAGYGQVGFNYGTPEEPTKVQPAEADEPFVPSTTFKALFSSDILLPEMQKQNAIIEKTSKFIATQGAQMEILIKAKQADNPQFKFMNKDSPLHPYYTALIGLIKAGKWPEKIPEPLEEKQPDNEEYLHPSLASTVIESAPSIPSIHYKPSADCDYTLLMYKMAGLAPEDEPAPGEEPPPGTRPLNRYTQQNYTPQGYKLPANQEAAGVRDYAMISKGPVVYNKENQDKTQHTLGHAQPPQNQQYAAYYQQYMAYAAQAQQSAQLSQQPKQEVPKPPPLSLHDAKKKSTGLSLMNHYNTDSDSDGSDSDSSSSSSKDKITIVTPPEDVRTVIDKMAAYVARNGDEFEEIVRAKNDPRFTFLEPNHQHHAYYKKLMQRKRGDANGNSDSDKKNAPTVSFSIKKQKEPEPILPKPALPYESSSDEESDKQTDKQEENQEAPTTNIPQVQRIPNSNIPQIVVYKLEDYKVTNVLPTVSTIETVPKIVQTPTPTAATDTPDQVVEAPRVAEKPVIPDNIPAKDCEERRKEKSGTPDVKRERVYTKEKEYDKDKEYEREREYRKHKSKHKDRKKQYRDKSEVRESKKSERRSVEREKKKERDRAKDKKRSKDFKEELENEIISLEDNSDDMIDLTGEQSDSKGETESESDKLKQQARRRRAAEFLKKVGVEPPPAALATNSLASAMVDTLESIRKKKAEEDDKRRRREKRRHRDREEEYRRKRRKHKSSDEQSDYEGKRKKRRNNKKSSKNKRRRKSESEEEVQDHPLNIDLTSTLKELRTASPSTELGLQEQDESTQVSGRTADSSSEGSGVRVGGKTRREDREYSEGEWSSDSEDDSVSTATKE